jgi:transcriptional regulator with XRE-family HTH domain
MTKEFQNWLRNDIDASGLTYGDYGELVGVKHPTVSGWVNGKHLPEAPKLRRLAEVRGQDPVTMFRMVGYLPNDGDEKPLDPERAWIIRQVLTLEPEDVHVLADVVRSLGKRRRRRK